MRISKKKTTVAVLRHIVKMKTPEFAEMVGLSLSAIEKMETGRLKLSDEAAFKLSHETGVDYEWLLSGDPSAPPKSRKHLRDSNGADPFSFEHFALRRTELNDGDIGGLQKAGLNERTAKDFVYNALYARMASKFASIRCMGLSSQNSDKSDIFFYYLDKALGDLQEKFGESTDHAAVVMHVEDLQYWANYRIEFYKWSIKELVRVKSSKSDEIEDCRARVRIYQFIVNRDVMGFFNAFKEYTNNRDFSYIEADLYKHISWAMSCGIKFPTSERGVRYKRMVP